jgi:two-component system, LytTR family, response regulator
VEISVQENWSNIDPMHRAVIIDDETHILDTLSKLVARHCSGITVVGTASSVTDGLETVNRLEPDLIFLDLNLGDGSGFDLLRALDEISFSIIFISSFDKATIQAFRLSGIDFLVKPISPADLVKTVKQAERQDRKDLLMQIQALEANTTWNKKNQKT